MNKYELALVVSANVEDEVRNATIEQVKELITRFWRYNHRSRHMREEEACLRYPEDERRFLQLH